MKTRLFCGCLLVLAGVASGCVVKQKDTIVTSAAGSNDCWVKLYDADNFSEVSSYTTLQGPVELATMANLDGKDWRDQIESLIVGPGARVELYKSENYAGTPITFNANQRVEKLGDLNYEDDVESLKLTCDSQQ